MIKIDTTFATMTVYTYTVPFKDDGYRAHHRSGKTMTHVLVYTINI